MPGRHWTVTLRRGTNSKSIKVYATSESNARYEAERQNPGWTVADIRPG